MAKYLLYAHLESYYVSNGQELNGYQPVGIIGATGSGAVVNGIKQYHLHLAVEEKSTDPDISFFYKWGSATRNPHDIIKQYGKVSPNDITLEYKATTYPYSSSNPHEGLDISGVIDKNYESAICYSPEFGKVKVIKTGYDNSYGNYVICKLLGAKMEKSKPTVNLTNVTDIDQVGTQVTILGTSKLNNGSMLKPWIDLIHLETGDKYSAYLGTGYHKYKYNLYRDNFNSETSEFEKVIDLHYLPKGEYQVNIGNTDVMSDGERISVKKQMTTGNLNDTNWTKAIDEAQSLILEIRNKTQIYITKK